MAHTTRKKCVVAAAVVACTAALGHGPGSAVDQDHAEAATTGEALDQATAAALEETGGGRVTGSEIDDEDSRYEVEVTLDDGSQVDVQLDQDFAVVSTEADHEDDGEDDAGDGAALTGRDLERATEAALAEAGGGRVTDSEADHGGFEVEVTLDDGSQVDVQLDQDFAVVGSEPEHDD